MTELKDNNVKSIIELAEQRDMNLKNNEAVSVITIPSDYKVVDTEQYQDERNRFRGTFSTNSTKSFAKYVLDRDSANQCFVDNSSIEAMKCTAIFNLGDKHAPGHADDTAKLTLPITDEFKAFCNLERVSQQDLVDFVQDYAHCLRFSFEDDFEGAEHYEPLTLPYALRAFRSLTIKTAVQVTNHVGDLSSSKSALEQIDAESIVRLPRIIKMRTSLYEDLEDVEVAARVAVITSDDSLSFSIRIIAKQKQLSDASERFVDLMNKVLPDNTPIYVGEFKA